MLSDARRRNLGRLLRPGSIAAVGGRIALEVIRQSRKLGFGGRVYAVNPSRRYLAGVPCCARIEDLPEAPDAVFLGIRREATVEAVAELAAMGAGGAVCYAAGFAEVDDGRELERRLVAAAGDMAILGPNCYGLLNLLERVALWPDEHGAKPVAQGVALITQSGNIGITLTMQERGLPIAALLSVGNQAQLAVHDALELLAEDARITAIGLYLETISDPVGFARAALKCAQRRLPVVAIKAGRSETGARATLSHTSSLAGSDAVVDAFLCRYGILRVDSLAELLETLKLVSVLGSLPGRRVGSLSCSGGDAAMVADLALAQGLELPPLPERSVLELREALDARVAIANPLDYQTGIWADRGRMRRCFAGMTGAGFDATLLVLDYPRPAENDVAAWDVAVDAFTEAARGSGVRALVVASLPETLPAAVRERLMAAGIAPMQGLPECLRAIAAAAWLGDAWQRIAGSPPPLPMTGARIAQASAPPILMRESAAKGLLAARGVQVPAGEVVPIAQAATAAERLGFPVALKTAAEIAHKSDAGGVVLGLDTASKVAAAARRMEGLGDLVLVERMLPPPLLELIVGVAVDPQFGPHLVIGAGGAWVELWRDTALLLLPMAEGDVEAALRALRLWPLLAGHRGAPAADLDAIVDAVSRIGALAIEHADRLLELDVNPLMVYPAGRGAVAADALIRLAAPLEMAAPSMEQVA
jgi:acetate---CoA ligase (ADP-forming)